MKLTLPLIIVFLLSTGISSGQNVLSKSVQKKQRSIKKPKLSTFEEEMQRHKKSYDDCVIVNKYSAKQRLMQYPFSKAGKVVAVSYPYEGLPDFEDSTANSTPGLHIKNGILDTTSITENKELSRNQIDGLTNLLFNTFYRKKNSIHLEVHGACFYPRNAFLFYDDRGKIFDYLEICFECKGFYSAQGKLDLGILCNQKYELLRKFFMSIGIKNGV